VWEVIDTLRAVREADSDLVDDALALATAEAMGLSERKVRVAVRYYAAYRSEVDERIAANREAAVEAEAAWQAEQEMLRGGGRAS
jgi:dsDNA-specific endonuclease/ATPase MutS2